MRSNPSLPFCTTIVTIFFLLAVLPASMRSQTTGQPRTPVLVELFTSEGCSTCPPADALLAKLDSLQPLRGAEIIVLGEHVDYWDSTQWNDRFASRQFTERQNEYGARLRIDSVYTPQMIVDGKDQFVGNDGAHAIQAITKAAQTAKMDLTLSRPVVDGRQVSAALSSKGLAGGGQVKGDLYVALVDPTDTTQVRGGENGGRTLQHVGVVRTLKRVGSLKDLGAGPFAFSVDAPANSTPATMRLVAFAQRSGQGEVLGAVVLPVTQ